MSGLRFRLTNILKTVRADLGSDHGLTLVELLVAMAVVAIVSAAVGSVVAMLSRDYTTQNVSADVQQIVRDGVDLMAKDIRMAGLNPLKSADAGFGAVSATSIDFTVDRNINGVIDAVDGEHITYFYDGSQLIRRFNGDEDTDIPFAGNVTDLTFTYLDENDAVTSDPLEIRTVEISMTVRQPAGRDTPVERSYTTRVRCRNLGL